VTAAGLGVLAAVGSVVALVLTKDASPPARPSTAGSGAPRITQTSIDGMALGLLAADYKRVFSTTNPGFGSVTDNTTGFTSLVFGPRSIAVFFAPRAKRASIITTWNKADRTAEGIGPCSTVEQMKRAYGDAAQPTESGTFDDGTIWSWAVGDNLLFNSQNHRTITAVALYRGDPRNTGDGSPQSFANYFSGDRSCAP
jgi:hypothetical protein